MTAICSKCRSELSITGNWDWKPPNYPLFVTFCSLC